jgi:hypothetical protein
VLRTLGEVDLGREGMMRTKLRVNQLNADAGERSTIGLEIVKTSFTGFSVIPIRLRIDQAEMLKQLLEQSLQQV